MEENTVKPERRQKVEVARAWLTLALALVNMLVVIWGVAWWGRGMVAADQRLEALIKSTNQSVTEQIADHEQESSVHRTLSEEINIFVLRKEWDKMNSHHGEQMRELKSAFNRMDDKLDRVIELITEKHANN